MSIFGSIHEPGYKTQEFRNSEYRFLWNKIKQVEFCYLLWCTWMWSKWWKMLLRYLVLGHLHLAATYWWTQEVDKLYLTKPMKEKYKSWTRCTFKFFSIWWFGPHNENSATKGAKKNASGFPDNKNPRIWYIVPVKEKLTITE